MTWKQRILIAVLAIAAVALGASWAGSWVVLGEANPPERFYGTILSPADDDTLRRACFDCHSNETRWPWYASVPPFSFFVAHNVAEGREHLNFSEWDAVAPAKQVKALRESLEEIREGEMAPWDYRWAHPEAQLTGEEVASLQDAALLRYGAAMIAKGHGGAKGHGEGGGDDDDDEDDDDDDDD